MVEEGSVIVCPQPPVGSTVDVSPEGFGHPVYRSGFALSIALPVVNFARAEEPSQREELAEALDEALKAAALTEPQPEPLPEIVGHTPVEQEAPQTPFDQAPSLPEDTELPERLNVQSPAAEETNEPDMSKPESTEEEPGDEV